MPISPNEEAIVKTLKTGQDRLGRQPIKITFTCPATKEQQREAAEALLRWLHGLADAEPAKERKP